jgi:hypothetical protein
MRIIVIEVIEVIWLISRAANGLRWLKGKQGKWIKTAWVIHPQSMPWWDSLFVRVLYLAEDRVHNVFQGDSAQVEFMNFILFQSSIVHLPQIRTLSWRRMNTGERSSSLISHGSSVIGNKCFDSQISSNKGCFGVLTCWSGRQAAGTIFALLI